MENSPLVELLTDQLRDLYDAEKQLTKALPRLAKASADKELKDGFTKHVAETQGQVQRIEKIFETLGMKAKGKPCAAMKGLIEEGQEVISGDLDNPFGISRLLQPRGAWSITKWPHTTL